MPRLLALAAIGLALLAIPARAADIVTEAKAFMAAYAQDLAKGDRAALAARYDREGAHMIFAGQREFATHAQIAADYAKTWQPPASFEWRDLTYEPAGPDAVVVTGGFLWGLKSGVMPVAYTALLRRQDGALRIRLEHETPEPQPKAP